ncbi:MAG: hypothetical protein F7B60_07680 [Desulfurococcales archaeon]|nr:hypothetical protein [Desulfurococcales archaeon]
MNLSREDYDVFTKKLRRLKRRNDTLVVVTPEKIDPLVCYATYIHTLDAFRLSRNKARTLDLEALIIIYGDKQIGRLLSRLRNEVMKVGSYNICILYEQKHPGPEYLPEPPGEPLKCNELELIGDVLNKLESVTANYLSTI